MRKTHFDVKKSNYGREKTQGMRGCNTRFNVGSVEGEAYETLVGGESYSGTSEK